MGKKENLKDCKIVISIISEKNNLNPFEIFPILLIKIKEANTNRIIKLNSPLKNGFPEIKIKKIVKV